MKPAIAKRLRKVAQTTFDDQMETVVCSKCGQRFAIHNGEQLPETKLSEKQIAWLQDQFVWDHIQERKHHGNVELPDLG